MARTRYDVFLSYRRADTAAVEPLREELRRLGYVVFFDTQSIVAGEDWKARLGKAIASSRVLVLCWSADASQSEVVTFEYSSARALGKMVVPWMLDDTPLPVMLNQLNGITRPDAMAAATALGPSLGWTLGKRRTVQNALAAVLVGALCVGAWAELKPPPPPPPWEFQGEVIEPQSRVGIAGVEVDATPEQGATVMTHTDAAGKFDFHLPPPQTKTVHLVFRREGYQGDEATVPADKSFSTPLYKLP